jgi:hypothetical protein
MTNASPKHDLDSDSIPISAKSQLEVLSAMQKSREQDASRGEASSPPIDGPSIVDQEPCGEEVVVMAEDETVGSAAKEVCIPYPSNLFEMNRDSRISAAGSPEHKIFPCCDTARFSFAKGPGASSLKHSATGGILNSVVGAQAAASPAGVEESNEVKTGPGTKKSSKSSGQASSTEKAR